MVSLRVCSAVVLSFFAGASFAHEYWPTSGEFTYYYENDQGSEIILRMINGELMWTQGTCWSKHWFSTEANSLYMYREEALCQGDGMRIPTGYQYAPSLQVLGPSVDVGQAWTSLSFATDYYGIMRVVTFSGESVSAESVVVPAGTFDTIVLSLDFDSIYMSSGLYYLTLGVGPVILPDGYRLVAVEGVTATGQASWGELKSLYK